VDDFAIRITAWLSLAAWVYAEWSRASAGDQASAPRAAFTAGLLAMVVHSALAFALRYGFSQEAALRDAARQIEEVTGRPSSPRGFYANHVFLAWWTLEAAAWWRDPVGYAGRSLALVWASRLVFAFMFANGAIVFAHGPLRALGVLGLLAAIAAWALGGRGRR
jgi:hypothetical protein